MNSTFVLLKRASLLLVSCLLPLASANAQRDIPFSGPFPTAPTGLENLPLGEGPWTYPTAEGMDIKVSVVAKMEYPMALEFLPDGKLLTITRRGEIYLIENGELQPTPIMGGPPSVFAGESGAGDSPPPSPKPDENRLGVGAVDSQRRTIPPGHGVRVVSLTG